jgi:YidC/Oxa1 family membrane protein insertase
MKIDWLRTSLIGGMLIVAFLLVIRWNDFQERRIADRPSHEQTLPSAATPGLDTLVAEPETAVDEAASDIPEAPADPTTQAKPTPTTAPQSELISVTTDVLQVLIDTHGGDLVKVALPKHYMELDTPDDPFVLLNRTQSHLYIAQSGLVGPNGTDSAGRRPTFDVEKTRFSLGETDDQLVVDLRLTQDQVDITKRFTFTRGSNLIDIRYLINNRSDAVWAANIFGQIKRDDHVPPSNAGIGMQPYVGAAITTPESNYHKIDFDELKEDGPFKVTKVGGWVAMVQHYFMSAWVPDQDATNHYSLRKSSGSDIYLLGYTGERVQIAPLSTGEINTAFYSGPKNIKVLEKISPYLDLTVDYSWLWWIAKPLHFALDFIHGIVGNWGLAIILLTVLIKLIFFYPSAMSYRSMAKMRLVQPLMADLKERYGDDRQRMSSELMKLYKKEKVNPLGGCLPVLLQMPVFISLYWMIMESVELRHAPFVLWIQDLSVKDPYFILPLIMGATMYIQQKLNPKPADPTQAKVMQMMPIFFTFLFMVFPAGLVLYWVVNNALSITQQYIITRNIEAEAKAKAR